MSIAFNPVQNASSMQPTGSPNEKKTRHIFFNTEQNPSLLQPAGQVRAMGEALHTVVAPKEEPLPDQLSIDLTFREKEEPPVSKMRQLLNTFAEMVSMENKNWFQRGKAYILRRRVGFQDKFPKLNLEHDLENPKQVSLKIELEGVTRQELNKFATFLEDNADYLAKNYLPETS